MQVLDEVLVGAICGKVAFTGWFPTDGVGDDLALSLSLESVERIAAKPALVSHRGPRVVELIGGQGHGSLGIMFVAKYDVHPPSSRRKQALLVFVLLGRDVLRDRLREELLRHWLAVVRQRELDIK